RKVRDVHGHVINQVRIVCALAGAIVAVALPPAANGAAKPRLYSFGLNFEGDMGVTTNATNFNANPTPVRVRLPGATGAPGKVAAAGTNSFVITASNQLYGFGSNLRGQLGIAANVDTANANPIPTVVTLPGAGGKILQVAGGNAHTLAITSSGQLYAFGVNVYGQLGIPTNANTINANPTPAPVALPGAVGHPVQVATGFMHSIVLTSAGEVYAFGLNLY